MHPKTLIRVGAAATAAGVLLGWPAWAAVTWARYGRAPREPQHDPLVDRYLPTYEVDELHETRVAAPAALTYAVALGMGLQQSAVVRAIIHARERLMGAREGKPWPPGGIVAQMRASGWGVLAEQPGREVVLGTVTQPWRGDVQFRALSPEEFATFVSVGHVKIITTLSVEPVDLDASIFRTRTRVATTDPEARARFRRYWAMFSPGILLIRHALLRQVKRDAERRYREYLEHASRATLPATRTGSARAEHAR